MSAKLTYRPDLDLLKGLAIIAVVFYHTGWLATGYLGVDVFLAVNGFLVIPSLLKRMNNDSWRTVSLSSEEGYVAFLLRRIMRLWPLTLIAAALCLVVGYLGMLPDDYENLSQSVIATDLMSQNILSAVTTKNYWDAVNEYKPLMHFWYVGILVEFYLVMPLIFSVLRWICKKKNLCFESWARILLWVLFVLSFTLYLLPSTTTAERFYFLPYRLFELLAGGLVGIYFGRDGRTKLKPIWGGSALFLVLLLLGASWYLPSEIGSIGAVNGLAESILPVPQSLLLVLAVMFTCCILAARSWEPIRSSWLIFIGKMSFSIFVWHQILLAFYRYFVSDDMSLGFGAGLWCVTLILSVISYYCIEQRVRASWLSVLGCVVLMTATIAPATWVYLHAGVVRDVPELNIAKGMVKRGMLSAYCDRIYAYNKNFPNGNSKLNVLVSGVSFGRDFANILLESAWADKINLSYIFCHDEQYLERYARCDYLFTFSKKTDVPAYVWKHLNPKAKVIGLGTKNFGTSNGIVYSRRNSADYKLQTISINPNFYLVNEDWKQSWGEAAYIDFLELSATDDGKIRCFTDDGKFISADCRHLVEAGAKWFAEKINWDEVFAR